MSFLVLPAISICGNMTLANVWRHHSFETTSLRILPGFSLMEPCPGYTVRCLFVIRNISHSLSFSVSTNPWLYVQRQRGARKNLLIAEGSVMIAAGFSSSEIVRKKKAQCAPACVCVCECVSFGGSAELGILVRLGDAECVLLWLSWETWAAVVRSALNLLPALAFAGLLWLSAVAGYYYLLSFTCNQFYRVFSQNDPDTQGWQMQQRREADL